MFSTEQNIEVRRRTIGIKCVSTAIPIDASELKLGDNRIVNPNVVLPKQGEGHESVLHGDMLHPC